MAHILDQAELEVRAAVHKVARCISWVGKYLYHTPVLVPRIAIGHIRRGAVPRCMLRAHAVGRPQCAAGLAVRSAPARPHLQRQLVSDRVAGRRFQLAAASGASSTHLQSIALRAAGQQGSSSARSGEPARPVRQNNGVHAALLPTDLGVRRSCKHAWAVQLDRGEAVPLSPPPAPTPERTRGSYGSASPQCSRCGLWSGTPQCSTPGPALTGHQWSPQVQRD